jgi:hypothetical protein
VVAAAINILFENMKRLFFTAAGIFTLLHVYAQQPVDSGFKSRKLKIEEINLVSSYYNQDGNHAAVTGGIGSEKLMDIANVFDIKLIRYDKKLRKHTLSGELGIDHYTSASSDKVDLKANSSASHADTRIYPSVNWSVENETKGSTIGIGFSSSTEFDYQSIGANLFFAKKTKNKAGEFIAKLQTYLDQVKLIVPVELRPGGNNDEGNNYGNAARNTYAGSLSYSQIINEQMQLMVLTEFTRQKGYLSLPFHRVYFNDASVHQENLPDSRNKIPLAFRISYFAGDKFIIRTYYRFYTDDWGINSHTFNVEVPVKITPFISLSPYYRFYDQTASKYFAEYQKHTAQDAFYTSNFDYAAFNSNFFGMGIHIMPPAGIFRIRHFNMIELRYGHYMRSNGLNSDIISLNLKFK